MQSYDKGLLYKIIHEEIPHLLKFIYVVRKLN